MAHPALSGDEIRQRGKSLYETRIRPVVETPDNIGKVVVMDIETGDYLIDEDRDNPTDAALALQSKHPGAALWGERIGYDAVFALGVSDLRRTAK